VLFQQLGLVEGFLSQTITETYKKTVYILSFRH